MNEPKWMTKFKVLAYKKRHLLPRRGKVRGWRFYDTMDVVRRKELRKEEDFDPEQEGLFFGFRNVIIYIQLHSQFTVDNKLVSILDYLDGLTHWETGGEKRFGLLFLNDENYHLIPYKRMLHKIQGVKDVVRYFYYNNYDQEYEQYSGRLTELFSEDIDWGGYLKPPIQEDLCLVFHKYGEDIKMDEEVREHYEKIKKSWIWIGWEGNEIKSIRDHQDKWVFKRKH